MKKILITITIILGITLSGCTFASTEPQDYLTEDDVNTLINQAVQDAGASYLESLSDEELTTLLADILPEDSVTTTFDLSSFNESITTMLETVASGVVGLEVATTTLEGTSYGTGSGVIYKKEASSSDFAYDYYLVTNNHVVEDADEIIVVYEKNGLLFQIPYSNITLLGTDPQTDLAVLKFVSSQEFAVVEFADSYQVEPGDFVFALGNPLGFDYYGTVTMGIISGATRYYSEVESDGDFDATVIQHDAEISPGNSGGALIDINGKLVGINFMKIVRDDVDGIGFAIPSNTVKRIAADLEDDGIVSKPYLGISTYAKVNDCGMEYGVCLSGVEAGLPADLAGLAAGDVIIGYQNEGLTEFVDIFNFNDLREAILNSSVEETVTVKYVDVNDITDYLNGDDVAQTVTVTLIERP